MESNPLFDGDISDVDSSSSAKSYTSVAPTITTPSTAVLQTVNIKSHVPIVLELTEPNHSKWRTFFDAFIGKFGLGNHLASPPTSEQRRDPEWRLLN
jgi:hypothetical protein